MNKEQVLAEIKILEERLAKIAPDYRIYVSDKPIYFNQKYVSEILDNMYQTLNIPKDHHNSDDLYVHARMIVTYYLNKHKGISAISIMKAMNLHMASGQYYIKKAPLLIATDSNCKNLYNMIIQIYGK